jgi:F0F1-type ATP synthase membrane subunit b/b'
MATVVTPRIASTLSLRHTKLAKDTEAAELLLQEAHTLRQQSAAHLSQERASSLQKIQDILKNVQKHKQQKLREFDHQFTQDCKTLESTLRHQSDSLLKDADDLVTHVASAIIKQLTSLSVDEGFLKTALKKIGTKNG